MCTQVHMNSSETKLNTPIVYLCERSDTSDRPTQRAKTRNETRPLTKVLRFRSDRQIEKSGGQNEHVSERREREECPRRQSAGQPRDAKWRVTERGVR